MPRGPYIVLTHTQDRRSLVQNMVQAGAAAADAATATEEATVSYMDTLGGDGQAPQDATSARPSQASHSQPADASPGYATCVLQEQMQHMIALIASSWLLT